MSRKTNQKDINKNGQGSDDGDSTISDPVDNNDFDTDSEAGSDDNVIYYGKGPTNINNNASSRSIQVYDPTKDNDNYLPIDNLVDPMNHYITIFDINNEILEPGRFLKQAIEHMVSFGLYNQPSYWPYKWLDSQGSSKRRFVHPNILKERQPSRMVDLSDVPECTWTEHERALLMHEHEEDISSNIEDFLQNGMTDELVTLAKDLTLKFKEECKHLPLIWSVVNIRIPNMVPRQQIVYLDSLENMQLLSATMISLIQSRYMINIAVYDEISNKITTLDNTIFEHKFALAFPLVVVDKHIGNVFFIWHEEDILYSLYSDTDELGNKVIKAIKATCPWWNSGKNSKLDKEKKQRIHGLVSKDMKDIMDGYVIDVKVPLALEMVCHVLTLVIPGENENIDQGEMSLKLSTLIEHCPKNVNFQDKYDARMWWAIVRGELGVQSDAMTNFNDFRHIVQQKRASWDYKQRYKISQAFTEHDWAIPADVFHLLDSFDDFDAISFSNNTVIRKADVIKAIVHPLTTNGSSVSVTHARVDALNRLYSDKGGPRLYSQKDLDYMMTNIEGKPQRDKLTKRLYWGKPVYFILLHDVSLASTEKYGIESHAALCKVRYTNEQADTTNSRRRPKHHHERRELVVQWLEGVFQDVYKLCAVPILTYLSLYFNAEVRQVQYSMNKTLCVNGPYCAVIALYAANQRMLLDKKKKTQSDWDAFEMPVAEALDFRTRLMYSTFLMKLPNWKK